MEAIDWTLTLTTALLLFAVSDARTIKCPSECECRPLDREVKKQLVDCSNRSLVSLPEHYSHHAFKLNLSFNHFTELKTDFFGKGSHDLHSIFLNNNSISSIAEKTFWVLPSLWKLDLSGNKLRTLETHMFDNNSAISYLILRGNEIKIPTNRMLIEAPSLITLDLSYNNIEALDDSTFSGLTELKSLRLHNNKLTSVSKTWFQGLKKLRHLFLEDNSLHYLHPDTFVYTENLIELILSRNNLMINSGQPFLRIPTLERLFLIGCNLTFLSGEMFEMTTRIRYLFLNNNLLSSLDPEVLGYLERLVYLNACDNSFTCDCGLKDAWEWCHYRHIKADVNCVVEGQEKSSREMCAGSWNVVGSLVCNATTPSTTTSSSTTSTTATAVPLLTPPEAVSAQSSSTGLFVGLGVGMVLIVLAVLGVLYWRYSTRRTTQFGQPSHRTTRLADMLPLQNQDDD